MQNLSISIPKPCHEDWNQMTAEERGRFCSKCSKTVFDFSGKTTNEIHQYVLAHRDEKMCGRFRNDQLNQPVAIQISAQTADHTLSPFQIFLVAALIVFGSSLFSCTPPAEQYSDSTTGIIMTDINDYISMVTEDIPGKTDSILSKTLPLAKHDIPKKACDNEMLKGKLLVEPDTIFETLPTVEVEATQVPLVCHSLTGLIAIQIVDEANFKNDSVEAAENKNENAETKVENLTSHIYPNPTDGVLNVEIRVVNEEFTQIDLYDLAGKHICNLLAKQVMQPGLNSLRLNIGSQPAGIYFLRIVAGNKIKTEKVVFERK